MGSSGECVSWADFYFLGVIRRCEECCVDAFFDDRLSEVGSEMIYTEFSVIRVCLC